MEEIEKAFVTEWNNLVKARSYYLTYIEDSTSCGAHYAAAEEKYEELFNALVQKYNVKRWKAKISGALCEIESIPPKKWSTMPDGGIKYQADWEDTENAQHNLFLTFAELV